MRQSRTVARRQNMSQRGSYCRQVLGARECMGAVPQGRLRATEICQAYGRQGSICVCPCVASLNPRVPTPPRLGGETILLLFPSCGVARVLTLYSCSERIRQLSARQSENTARQTNRDAFPEQEHAFNVSASIPEWSQYRIP